VADFLEAHTRLTKTERKGWGSRLCTLVRTRTIYVALCCPFPQLAAAEEPCVWAGIIYGRNNRIYCSDFFEASTCTSGVVDVEATSEDVNDLASVFGVVCYHNLGGTSIAVYCVSGTEMGRIGGIRPFSLSRPIRRIVPSPSRYSRSVIK
jgi:hypothetical protein